MLVLGIVCILAFGLNEKFLAPVPFLQWEILKSRTVMGACALDVCYQISYYCWLSYYTSFLQVNSGQSLEVAGYISSIFDVVSGVWLFVVGFAIKRTSRFRWMLYWAVPLYMLGQGLMIYFRKPDQAVGYLIMCQIFLAFAGGAMIIVQQVAVLAASDHQNAAGSLAFLGVFGNIGGAVVQSGKAHFPPRCDAFCLRRRSRTGKAFTRISNCSSVTLRAQRHVLRSRRRTLSRSSTWSFVVLL
jgi:predicted MFS family arabinose efflux permease